MGCFISTPKDGGGNRRKPGNVGEVVVFVPGLRIPKAVDFSQPLGSHLSKNLVERLSALRARIVVIAGQEVPATTKPRRKTATQQGGSTLYDLQQALEDYLPLLLGLVKDGSQVKDLVQFVWVNQEDDAEETAILNAWYEVLSVLHLMAMLSLSQANLLLLPRTSTDGCQPKVSEVEGRRASVDVFLKASGYLDCAIRHVLPQIPLDLRRDLPVDMSEGVLRALSLQALGLGVDIQLGMAIDSTKATLAVKRRLACEMVKYWHQAQENIVHLPLTNGWGEKHQLFVKWKYVEAKAAAYYYHGLILDEGNTEKSHSMAVAALQAAEEFLKESKKASEAFNMAPPTSRSMRLNIVGEHVYGCLCRFMHRSQQDTRFFEWRFFFSRRFFGWRFKDHEDMNCHILDIITMQNTDLAITLNVEYRSGHYTLCKKRGSHVGIWLFFGFKQ